MIYNTENLQEGDHVKHVYSFDELRNEPLGPRFGVVTLAAEKICFVKFDKTKEGYSGEEGVPYNEVTKVEKNFQLYKNSKGVHFVKYADLDEKQIGEGEYNELQSIKDRALQAKVNEPVIYEQKKKEMISWAKHVSGTVCKMDPVVVSSSEFNISYGSLKGRVQLLDQSYVLTSISNEDKGNGQFAELLELLKYKSKESDKYFVVDNIYNPKLVAHLKSIGFIQLTNTTCLWKT